ncbi:MAG: glycosyltransferase family 4 protein [bacterium]
MINVAFVRGAFLNEYEWQNYDIRNKKLSVIPISSNKPLSTIKNSIKQFSLTDISNSKVVRFIANRTIGDSQILFGLKKILNNFDLIHTGDPHYYYSYQAARFKNKQPLISTYWETIPFNNESTKRKKIIKKHVQNKTNIFICHTQKAKKSLITEGFKNKRIEVVPLGVDLTRFKPIKVKNRKHKTILFVGRLVKEKGILDLYSAFKICLANNKDLKLSIIGDGPLKKTLASKIKKDHLEFYINIKSQEYSFIHNDYQSADIFVLPSKKTKTWEEQYGMVLIEALASGLSIIAYNSGAISEVLDTNGILVKEGNVNDLSLQIARLINNDNKMYKLKVNGRKYAEKRYNCINYQKTISKIYSNLI